MESSEIHHIEYTIKKGDTLSAIAKRHGIKDFRVLADLNNIENPNLILIGDILQIPQSPQSSAHTETNNAKTPSATTTLPTVVPSKTAGSVAAPEEALQRLREAIVGAVESQVGVTEVKDNIAPQITEYRKYTGQKDGAAWCADFASYILEKIHPDIITPSSVAGNLVAQFRAEDAFIRLSEADPKPGDLIFFDRSTPGETWKRHVGFVVGYDPETKVVTTVEGNKSLDNKNPWSEQNKDGVRLVTYTPEQLAAERYLGIGDIAKLVNNNINLDSLPETSALIAKLPSPPANLTIAASTP